MLILLKKGATDDQVAAVEERVRQAGLTPGLVPGKARTAITVTGNWGEAMIPDVRSMPGVMRAIRVSKPYRLATAEAADARTEIAIGEALVGSDNAWFVAGPCSVDEESRLLETAHYLKSLGAQALRGGAYKPRSNPYAFQGHGEPALQMLARAREATGLPIVTEAMDLEQLAMVEEYADVVQIGARNMQNYSLLKRVGRSSKPVILKRGLSASVDELLNAAEYILKEGNCHVILCERGVRTFASHSRFTLDVAAIPVLKALTHLPVIVDPSHPAGVRNLVRPLARAGIAAGADGLLVEVHPEPEHALSDADQALRYADVASLAAEARGISQVLNRSFGADAD
ncbi:MAG: 3-deoxy-7-phosphoheptulonate synthase [Deltaproteobacteria bacterium]|nr:3-deoxy-7-phosphoheptulonate synthase [Deltaproteobacteria bacterium]